MKAMLYYLWRFVRCAVAVAASVLKLASPSCILGTCTGVNSFLFAHGMQAVLLSLMSSLMSYLMQLVGLAVGSLPLHRPTDMSDCSLS